MDTADDGDDDDDEWNDDECASETEPKEPCDENDAVDQRGDGVESAMKAGWGCCC